MLYRKGTPTMIALFIKKWPLQRSLPTTWTARRRKQKDHILIFSSHPIQVHVNKAYNHKLSSHPIPVHVNNLSFTYFVCPTILYNTCIVHVYLFKKSPYKKNSFFDFLFIFIFLFCRLKLSEAVSKVSDQLDIYLFIIFFVIPIIILAPPGKNPIFMFYRYRLHRASWPFLIYNYGSL